jgi:hypothetical protein
VRRYLGYVLALFTAYEMGEWVHRMDASWAWYSNGPQGSSDDPLALVVAVVVAVVGCWAVSQVTPSRDRRL